MLKLNGFTVVGFIAIVPMLVLMGIVSGVNSIVLWILGMVFIFILTSYSLGVIHANHVNDLKYKIHGFGTNAIIMVACIIILISINYGLMRFFETEMNYIIGIPLAIGLQAGMHICSVFMSTAIININSSLKLKRLNKEEK